MQNAVPTTRFLPDESGLRFAQLPSHCLLPTAYCLPPTAYRALPAENRLAVALYTGGHLLEKGPKILTFSHFSAGPARLFDGKARSASRFMTGGLNLRCGLPERAKQHVRRGPQNSHIDFG
jgi:hypothetical protein